MSLCILCGTETPDATLLCPHHATGPVDWSDLNRAFCDLLHRGITPIHPPSSGPDEAWVLAELDVMPEVEAVTAP